MASLLTGKEAHICEPTPGAGNLVKALGQKWGVTKVICPDKYEDFWKWRHKDHPYDSYVMNPPFHPATQGYSFLYHALKKARKVVALMPWWTLINSEKRTKLLVESGLHKIIHLPRSVFPGARIQTCIMAIDKSKVGDNIEWSYHIRELE